MLVTEMPVSSITSRRTAFSADSPASIKPAKQEKYCVLRWLCCAKRISLLRFTRTMMHGSIRGNMVLRHCGHVSEDSCGLVPGVSLVPHRGQKRVLSSHS